VANNARGRTTLRSSRPPASRNARLAAPALQELISAGVIDELLSVLNDLLYGCKAVP
jgi:hypothetical protein